MSTDPVKMKWSDLSPGDTAAAEADVAVKRPVLDEKAATYHDLRDKALGGGYGIKMRWDDLTPTDDAKPIKLSAVAPANLDLTIDPGVYKPARFDPFSGKPTVRQAPLPRRVADPITVRPAERPMLVPQYGIKDEVELGERIAAMEKQRADLVSKGFPTGVISRQINLLSQYRGKTGYLLPTENIRDPEELDAQLRSLSEQRAALMQRPEAERRDSIAVVDRQITALSRIKNDLGKMRAAVSAAGTPKTEEETVAARRQVRQATRAITDVQAPSVGGRPRDEKLPWYLSSYAADAGAGVAEGGGALVDAIAGVRKMFRGMPSLQGLSALIPETDLTAMQEGAHQAAMEGRMRGGEGISHEVMRGLTAMGMLLPALAAGGTPMLALMGAAQAAGQPDATPGQVMMGAATMALMGKVLHASEGLSIPKRVLTGAITGAALSALEGADREKVIAQALLFGGLGAARRKPGERIKGRDGRTYEVTGETPDATTLKLVEEPLTRAGSTDMATEVRPPAAPESAHPAVAENRYTLERRASEPAPDGGTTHLYAINRPEGTPTEMTVSISPDGKVADIDWIGETVGGVSEIGTSGVRQVLRQLRAEHPGLEEVTGFRVSGVRGEAPERITLQLNRGSKKPFVRKSQDVALTPDEIAADRAKIERGEGGLEPLPFESVPERRVIAENTARFEQPNPDRPTSETTAPAVEPAAFGASNRLVTAAAKDEAVARLKARLSSPTLSAGLDPELLADAARVGAFYLEGGVRSFAAWSARMTEELGDEIKPHLAALFAESRAHLKNAELSVTAGSRERSLPSTLEAHGMLGGTDRHYDPISNEATLREATRQADEVLGQRGVDGAVEWIRANERVHPTDIATGHKLIDALQDRAEATLESDPAEADRLMTAADQVASIMSERLTRLGQAVQAVRVIEKIHPSRIAATAQKILDRAKPGERLPDAQKTELVREARDIQATKRRLREATEAQTKTPTDPRWTDMIERETRRLTEQRKQLARNLESLDRMGTFRRRTESAISGLRTLKTAWDLSAPGRQGFLFAVTHPWAGLAKPFAKQLQALGAIPDVDTPWGRFQRRLGLQDYREMEMDLAADPDFQQMLRFGSEMTGTGTTTATGMREEPFQSSWAEKIPGAARSEQAYSTFLNTQRLNMYKVYKGWLGRFGYTPEANPNVFAGVVRLINDGTGRGTPAGAANLKRNIAPEDFARLREQITQGRRDSKLRAVEESPVGTMVPFAYRWMKSRFNLLNPLYYIKLPTPVRLIALKEGMQFVGTVMLTGWLAKQAGASVALDPNDPDFLKVRFGNTHYDLTGGFQNEARFLLRLYGTAMDRLHGTVKKKGDKWVDKQGNDHPGLSDIALDFGRSKLAPIPGAVADYATGEMLDYDATGKRKAATPANVAINLWEPMVERDLREAWDLEGGRGFAKALPTVVGIGTQTYRPKPKGGGGTGTGQPHQLRPY